MLKSWAETSDKFKPSNKCTHSLHFKMVYTDIPHSPILPEDHAVHLEDTDSHVLKVRRSPKSQVLHSEEECFISWSLHLIFSSVDGWSLILWILYVNLQTVYKNSCLLLSPWFSTSTNPCAEVTKEWNGRHIYLDYDRFFKLCHGPDNLSRPDCCFLNVLLKTI